MQNLKPWTVSVLFFALSCERIFMGTHSTESRCYRTGKYTVCRRVRASFSPEILQAGAAMGLKASWGEDASWFENDKYMQRLCMAASSITIYAIAREVRFSHRQTNKKSWVLLQRLGGKLTAEQERSVYALRKRRVFKLRQKTPSLTGPYQCIKATTVVQRCWLDQTGFAWPPNDNNRLEQ